MPKTPFLEFITDRVALFDGGVGTELYHRGIFINRNYDELNLSADKLVREVHESFVGAGVDAIETNTFGANWYRLESYGLQDKVREINIAGARLARECAGDDVYVAGSIGPLGKRIEPWGPTSIDEARAAFKEQAEALLEGGIDLFCVETFEDLGELQQAIEAVREVAPDKPIIASLAINQNLELPFGTLPETYGPRLEEWACDIIGINRTGPRAALAAIERVAKVTEKPLSAMPDAGAVQQVDGRNMYMVTTEYMAEFARRFIAAGCKVIGGDCGVSPDFIQAMRKAMRADVPGQTASEVARKIEATELKPAPDVTPIPMEDRSRFARKVASGQFVTSIEITPPRSVDPSKILKGAAALHEAGVDAVNVPDGPRAAARMSAMATAYLIEQECGIETVLHYACRDRNLLGMMSDALGLYAMGLRNFLAITGDPPKMGDYPDATAVFDVDAIGLVNMINHLNHGIDPGNNFLKEPTGWLIGVGCEPGAIDVEREVRRFEWKVQAGAEFCITQPVFDLQQLFDFMEKIEHTRIPLVAGVWPLVSLRNAEFMHNEVPGVVVPDWIMDRMRAAQDKGKEFAREEGKQIALEMIEQLKDHVQGVQVSAPLGMVKFALGVLDAVKDKREPQGHEASRWVGNGTAVVADARKKGLDLTAVQQANGAATAASADGNGARTSGSATKAPDAT